MPSDGKSVKWGSCWGSRQQPLALAHAITLTKVSGSQKQTNKQAKGDMKVGGVCWEECGFTRSGGGVETVMGEVTMAKTHKCMCKKWPEHLKKRDTKDDYDAHKEGKHIKK